MNNAFERARAAYGTGAYDDATLEFLFPALKESESEDERIRKCIGMALTDVDEQRFIDYGVTLKDCLIYIEKQKELFESGRGLYYYDGEKTTYCGYPATEDNPYDFAMSQQEKQKEQKPNIEICPHSIKSKSYKENFYPIEDCDYGLEIAYDILENTLGKVQGYQTDDGIREHQTAIEAVRKAKEQKPWKVGANAYFTPEQKPAEKQDYSGLTDLERAIHRGFLCAGVENVPVTIIKETAQECLAQMKPAEWSEEDEQMLELVIANYKYMTRKLRKGDGSDDVAGDIEVFSWLEFLPERFNLQPKAEWCEEDNIGWDEAFACVTRAEKAAKNEEELQNAVTAEKWLKEIKFKYYVHPVKQEWSEKDEKMRKDILQSLKCYQKMFTSERIIEDINDEIFWLKSLPLNLKKKNEDTAKLCSNEWSEEDEHRRTDAIYFLESAKRHYADTSEIEKTIDWLKSLRPSWKPSEEQMKALIDCVIGDEYDVHALVRLWAELKKL